MSDTLAIMITMTTYGTWLRGDARGWVDDGVIYPPNPELEDADRVRLKHPVFRLPTDQLMNVGQWIGQSLIQRLEQQILAMTVQTWHVHFVIKATSVPVGRVIKCAKDAVRWGLQPNQPIWTEGYDKQYCFDEESVRRRIRYVERHNEEHGLPARPWEFIDMTIL